jgi:acetyltransferase-like isoleucine patch superfamily enzyme
MSLLTKIGSGLRVSGRILHNATKRTLISVSNDGIVFEPGVGIARGANLRSTDGGEIHIGKNSSIDQYAHILAKYGRVSVGSDCYIGIGAVIRARDHIRIGDDVLVAEYVTIRDQDHDFSGILQIAHSGFKTAPVTIGNNVWIGAKSTITRGVSIGDNSVIGANSVVTRSIPANSVAVGVPARVIKTIVR